MNREIEFRVFDPVKRKFIYFTIDDLVLNRKNFQFIIDYPFADKDQYIGIKDKNGIKIFEGDIMKSNDYLDIYFTKGAVIYDNEETAFVTYSGRASKLLIGSFTNIEVIGNIYENSDLLNKNTNE